MGPFEHEVFYYIRSYFAHIPQVDRPIFAWSGMRLLLEDKANDLVDSIQDVLLKKSYNPFNFTRQNARILSGEEEGAYAWVSVNYLRGAFTQSGNISVLRHNQFYIYIDTVP